MQPRAITLFLLVLLLRSYDPGFHLHGQNPLDSEPHSRRGARERDFSHTRFSPAWEIGSQLAFLSIPKLYSELTRSSVSAPIEAAGKWSLGTDRSAIPSGMRLVRWAYAHAQTQDELRPSTRFWRVEYEIASG